MDYDIQRLNDMWTRIDFDKGIVVPDNSFECLFYSKNIFLLSSLPETSTARLEIIHHQMYLTCLRSKNPNYLCK